MDFIEIKTKASQLLDSSRNIIINNEAREKSASAFLDQVNECLDELSKQNGVDKNKIHYTVTHLTAAMSFLVKALDVYRFKIKAQIEAKENLAKIREEKRKMINSLQNKTLSDADKKAEQIKKEVVEDIKNEAEKIIKRGRGRPPKKELVEA